MALSAFICLFALLVLVVYQLRNKIHRYEQLSKFQKARGCGAPRQTTNRLLGLLEILQLVQALKKNYFLKYVEGLFGKYGNTFAYNTIGTQAIWTMEPENIKACLSTQSQDFEVGATRHNTLIPLLGHSILTTDGSQWAHHRAMIRPNFVKSQLVNVDIFEKHVSNLLACIPQDNSTFDIRDLFQKLTMDISTDFLLGCSTNSLALHATRSKDEFSEAWATAISWLPLRAHLGSLMNWIPHPSFFKACKTVQAYADELVAFALASRQFLGKDETSTAAYENRYIFLHELAKEVTDPIQLRDHVISVLSAGRDTTSELLSCTINILVKNRGVLALLREEVSQLNGQKPTFEMLKEMGYLRNVLFEGPFLVQLHPPSIKNISI
jgi:cytochrome P450